jgi:LuxR family transcriptional regulator, activator of conjugal transfer of Ti plasmids
MQDLLAQPDREPSTIRSTLPRGPANNASYLTLVAADASFSERYIDTVSQFVERLNRAERAENMDCTGRVDELKQIFSHAAASLGFKHFTYHIVRSRVAGSTAGRLPYIISNYPDAWVRHYFREHYLDEDPVVGEFMRHREPFLWTELARPENLSWRQRRLIDEARDAGIVDGITLPIHNRGEIAAVSLIPSDCGGEAGSVMRRHQHVLHLMALHYHALAHPVLLEKSLSAESSRRRSLLSPREKQALEWAARGKSNLEISAILDISSKSVEFHMEGAKRKLQVFNRTHAVAKAIILGLISFD